MSHLLPRKIVRNAMASHESCPGITQGVKVSVTAIGILVGNADALRIHLEP